MPGAADRLGRLKWLYRLDNGRSPPSALRTGKSPRGGRSGLGPRIYGAGGPASPHPKRDGEVSLSRPRRTQKDRVVAASTRSSAPEM
jgi:hypothetical protein